MNKESPRPIEFWRTQLPRSSYFSLYVGIKYGDESQYTRGILGLQGSTPLSTYLPDGVQHGVPASTMRRSLVKRFFFACAVSSSVKLFGRGPSAMIVHRIEPTVRGTHV